jgi:Eukaryotic aspartyl protease
VFSSELPQSVTDGHNSYDPKNSPTAKLMSGSTWSVHYGDGSSASGNVYTVTVSQILLILE